MGDVLVRASGEARVGAIAHAIARSGGAGARVDPDSNLSLAVERSGAVLDPKVSLNKIDLRSGDHVDLIFVTDDMELEGDADPDSEQDASLRILSGPLAGNVFRLPGPSCTLGRSPDNDVVLRDPSVSRNHATFVIDAHDVVVTDLGSTNGIHIDGQSITTPTRVLSGKRILIGRSWAAVEYDKGANHPVDGRILVEPSQRLPRYHGESFDVPAPPEASGSRMRALSGRNSAASNYQKILDDSAPKLDAIHARERAARLNENPSFSAVLDGIRSRTRVWERGSHDNDRFEVRLGLAELPSRSVIAVEPGGDVNLRASAERLPRRYQTLDGVPVTVDIAAETGLVLRGSVSHTRPLAASLVGQLVGLQQPAHLGVVVLSWSSDALSVWNWLAWLPHGHLAHDVVPGVGDLAADSVRRLLDAEVSGRPNNVLVVVDGEPPARYRELLGRLADEGQSRGIQCLVLAGLQDSWLPVAAGAWPVVAVGDRVGRLMSSLTGTVDPIALEVCTRQEARAFGRALAGLSLRGASSEPSDRDGQQDIVVEPLRLMLEAASPVEDVENQSVQEDLSEESESSELNRQDPEATDFVHEGLNGNGADPLSPPPAAGPLMPSLDRFGVEPVPPAVVETAASPPQLPDALAPEPQAQPEPVPEPVPELVPEPVMAEAPVEEPSTVRKGVAPEVLAPEPPPLAAEPSETEGQPLEDPVDQPVDEQPVDEARERSSFVDLLTLPRPGNAYRLVLGLVDTPGSEKSSSFAFNPTRDASLGLVGPAGSGKSTCLRSAAASVMRLDRPVEKLPLIYQLGLDSELAPIALLPTARGAAGELDRIGDVLSELGRLIEERSVEPSSSGDQPGYRPVLVLIDDLHDVLAGLETTVQEDLRSTLERILVNGGSADMHVVLTVDSGAEIEPWLTSNVSRWITLHEPSVDVDPGSAAIGSTPIRFAALAGELPGASIEESFRSLGSGPAHSAA